MPRGEHIARMLIKPLRWAFSPASSARSYDDVPAETYRALPPIDVRAMAHVLRRLTGYALRYKVRSALAVISALGAAIFGLLTPRLLGRAVDQAQSLLAAGSAQCRIWLALQHRAEPADCHAPWRSHSRRPR